MRKSRSYIATPPGATIKEQLVDRGMSQKEFAARMDTGNFDIVAMRGFAAQVGVDIGIVVGRLQKECYIKYSQYNELKTRMA